MVLADLLVHVVRVEAGRGYGSIHAMERDEATLDRLLEYGLEFCQFVSGTSNLLRSVSQMMPRKIRRVDGRVVHFFNDMK